MTKYDELTQVQKDNLEDLANISKAIDLLIKVHKQDTSMSIELIASIIADMAIRRLKNDTIIKQN